MLGDLWTLSMKFSVTETLPGLSLDPQAYSRRFLKFFDEEKDIPCQKPYDFFVIDFFIEIMARMF